MESLISRGIRRMAITFIKKHNVGSILESAVYGKQKVINYSKKGSIIESKVFGDAKGKGKLGYSICGKK